MNTQRSYQKALVFVFLSTICLSLAALGVRSVRTEIGSHSMAFLRCLLQTLMLLPAFYVYCGRKKGVRSRLLSHFGRGTFGVAGMFCFYSALQYLPLGLSNLVSLTSIVWVTLFAGWFLKEWPPRRHLMFGLLLCAGVGVSLFPSGELAQNWSLNWMGVGFGLLSGLLMGAARTLQKKLRLTTSAFEIVFFFGVVGVILFLPLFISNPQWPRSVSSWSIVIASSVLAGSSQLLFTHAVKYVSNYLATLGNFLGIIVNVLLGMIFLGEVPSAAFYLGLVIILGGFIGLFGKAIGKVLVPLTSVSKS